MLVHQDNRADWLEARKGYLTASDCAALLEVSKYKSRGVLMLEKAGLADDSFQMSDESTLVGLALEQATAGIATKLWGWQLEADGWLQPDSSGLLAATPDYQMATPWGRATVDIKVTSAQAQEDCKPRKSGEPSTAKYANGCPLDYAIQLQVQMACSGTSWAAVLVMHASGGFKVRAYPVRRNDILIARIRKEAAVFWSEWEQLTGEKRP